jgi:hypothetical protein
VEDIASLLSVRVGTPTLSKYTGNVGRAIVISFAGHAYLLTNDLFTTTVETFLEITYINWSR